MKRITILKKNVYVIVALSISLGFGAMMYACSDKNDFATPDDPKADRDVITTSVSVQEFLNVKDQLVRYVNDNQAEIAESLDPTTKSSVSNATENDLEQIFFPFIDDGDFLRREMLAHSSELGLSREDQRLLSELRNEDLATLSFLMNILTVGPNPYKAFTKSNDDDDDDDSWQAWLYSYQQSGGEINVIDEISDQDMKDWVPSGGMDKPSTDWGRTMSCLSVALGISAIGDLISGTVGLTTAELGWSLFKNLGKRYLGYAGLGVAAYEFSDCMWGS